MVTITLPEELAQRIEALAEQEHRSVVDVLTSMVEKYEPETGEPDPLDAIVGVFDDGITDLSTTVRETIQEHFRRKAHDSSS